MAYSNYREETTLSTLVYKRSITESGQGGLSGGALRLAIEFNGGPLFLQNMQPT